MNVDPTETKSATTVESDVAYAVEEEKAALKIQRHWRRIVPKISERREFALSPKGLATKHFLEVCAKHPHRLAIPVLLLSQAVEPYLKLATLRTSMRKRQEILMSLIGSADLPQTIYEAIDPIIQSSGHVDSLLHDQSVKMSEDTLGRLIQQKDLLGLHQIINVVSLALMGAETELVQLGSKVETVYEHVRKAGDA